MPKNVVELDGPQMTSQYGAYGLYMLDKEGYTHARVCTRPRVRAEALARARTHTHIYICYIYCFSTATVIRERASVLRYTYIG